MGTEAYEITPYPRNPLLRRAVPAGEWVFSWVIVGRIAWYRCGNGECQVIIDILAILWQKAYRSNFFLVAWQLNHILVLTQGRLEYRLWTSRKHVTNHPSSLTQTTMTSLLSFSPSRRNSGETRRCLFGCIYAPLSSFSLLNPNSLQRTWRT